MHTLLAVMLAGFAATASAQTTVRSGPARVRLVELYSSEGCSSCPPADAWASSLRGHKGLWKAFIPLVFHVTYWDYLGWTDPLADKSHTARQRAYAASWGTETVYTPGWVLDGAEWRGWGGEPPDAGSRAGVLVATEKNGRVSARFQPEEDAGSYDLYAARVGLGIESSVTRGENSGRKLKHDFVVTALASKRMRKEGAAWTAELLLPAPRVQGASEGFVVWAAGPNGRPVQAAGGETR